jgi:cytochrome c biogenesis protein CcmG/thiol:disulfide interchange protein DsbE
MRSLVLSKAIRISLLGSRGLRRRFMACVVSLLFPTMAFALDKGSTAPVFELPGNSEVIKLSHYRGKVVYLDFWASWCAPCKQSFPWMNQIQAKFGSQGLQIIGINLDEKNEDARQFLAAHETIFLIAFDPKATTARAYHIKGMPSSVLIDPDGKVIFEHAGFRNEDKADLENRIQAILKEK